MQDHNTNLRIKMNLPSFVCIKDSSIVEAGLGAFASEDIPAGRVLGDYTGAIVPEDSEGDYVLMVQGYNDKGREVSVCIDAESTDSGWPRYLNSVRNGAKPNCKFFINGDKISVKSIRDISQGSELLVDYGPDYVFPGDS